MSTIKVPSLWLLSLCLLLLALLRLQSGSLESSFWQVLQSLGQAPEDNAIALVVWELRLPRLLAAMGVGAALALAGLQLQTVFQNPLAAPGIIGISSGAALGAVIALALGLNLLNLWWLPAFAFIGAFAVLALLFFFSYRNSHASMTLLLLTGVALGAFFSALLSLLINLAWDDYQVAQAMVFWLMGGLDNRNWGHVGIIYSSLVPAVALSWYYQRELDLLLLGNEQAQSLGLDVWQLQQRLLFIIALLTAAAVAIAGVIGFVGLIVPHMMRLIYGANHQRLIPAVLIAGALFVLLCDWLAMQLLAPVELRLGVITAFFGAPFFLYLLKRKFA